MKSVMDFVSVVDCRVYRWELAHSADATIFFWIPMILKHVPDVRLCYVLYPIHHDVLNTS